MAKKSAKVAVTYVVTILLTLVIIGGVGWYLLQHFVLAEKKDAVQTAPIEQLVSESEYIPTSADKRTMLFILDAEKRQTASVFLLARFLPTEKQVVLLPLPSNTEATVSGSTDTLYEFYRNGGARDVEKAIESCLGITVDKYMKLSKSGFETVIDIFGGVDYYIPYNLVYSNTATGEETVLREGKTYLDSNSMRKVLTYPEYSSGEEYRAKCAGVAISDMLNANVDESFSSHLDDYFNSIINSDVETDVTVYDYEGISEAMKYTIDNYDKLAIFVPVSGTDDGSMFKLDEIFVKSLNEWFKLYDESTFETDTTVNE